MSTERKTCFREVYTVYYPKLVRFAAQWVVSREEAENIVQNIFLSLLEREDDFADLNNINAYLFRSVRNRCIDFLRAKTHDRRQSLAESSLCEMTLKMAAIEQFDDSGLSLDELAQKIDDAVGSLPPKCRQIFIMSRFDGHSHSVIAQKLGISSSTVNNQINTALRRLRQELKHFLPLFVFLSC